MRADAFDHRIAGLIERVSFWQYAGCCGFSDFGSATWPSSFVRVASISGVRSNIHTPCRAIPP